MCEDNCDTPIYDIFKDIKEEGKELLESLHGFESFAIKEGDPLFDDNIFYTNEGMEEYFRKRNDWLRSYFLEFPQEVLIDVIIDFYDCHTQVILESARTTEEMGEEIFELREMKELLKSAGDRLKNAKARVRRQQSTIDNLRINLKNK